MCRDQLALNDHAIFAQEQPPCLALAKGHFEWCVLEMKVKWNRLHNVDICQVLINEPSDETGSQATMPFCTQTSGLCCITLQLQQKRQHWIPSDFPKTKTAEVQEHLCFSAQNGCVIFDKTPLKLQPNLPNLTLTKVKTTSGFVCHCSVFLSCK